LGSDDNDIKFKIHAPINSSHFGTPSNVKTMIEIKINPIKNSGTHLNYIQCFKITPTKTTRANFKPFGP